MYYDFFMISLQTRVISGWIFFETDVTFNTFVGSPRHSSGIKWLASRWNNLPFQTNSFSHFFPVNNSHCFLMLGLLLLNSFLISFVLIRQKSRRSVLRSQLCTYLIWSGCKSGIRRRSFNNCGNKVGILSNVIFLLRAFADLKIKMLAILLQTFCKTSPT